MTLQRRDNILEDAVPHEYRPQTRQEGADAAELLEASMHNILEQWTNLVRTQFPAARGHSKLAIQDSIEEFCISLVAALRSHDIPLNVPRKSAISSKHGKQRGTLSGYTLDQVISEYISLQKIIFGFLLQKGAISVRETDIILEFFQEGMRRGAVEFTAAHEKVKAKALAAEQEYSRNIEHERAQLAAEKHKFGTIFYNAPAGIAIFRGPEFIIEKANADFFGFFDHRELIGKKLHEALPELGGQPFLALLRKVLETGEPYTGREVLARLARHDGAELEDRYFDFTFSRILDGAGNPYGISDHSIEVTDRVYYRRYLEESKTRLEKERELRERFVSALSHDLRNPLAAAKGGSDLLTRVLNNPAMIQDLAARISHSVDRADRMIRDLLDANRIQAGMALPLSVEECELNAVVRSTLEELAALHGERFVMPPANEIKGYWDCSALRRIVENLAGNAVKYSTPDTPVTVQLLQKHEGQISITVHNVGNPIPLEDQATLFQPFQRTKSAQQGGKKGWGIGLSLVQGLIEAHGGRVTVESSPAKGTLFCVELPLDARASQKLSFDNG